MRVLLFAVAIVSCAALRTTGRPLGRAQLLSQRAPVLSLAEPEVEAAEPESPLPPAAPMDPRKAVEELGSLVKQVQEVWTDGKNWDMEERARRRREIVSSYVAVFAPAVAFSGVQLTLSIGGFLTFLIGLKISGRGYADIVELSGVLPPLQVARQLLQPSPTATSLYPPHTPCRACSTSSTRRGVTRRSRSSSSSYLLRC